MPRNDQAVRLLVILQRLEASRQGVTLEQLADSLAPGTARHSRTLRRDLDALEDAGYPLVADRVDGRTRWQLLDGFRNVPGLRFSPTELMALTFTRRLIAPLEGTELHGSLLSALSKAAAVLPPQSLELVQQLDGTFSVGLGPHKRYRRHRETIDRVSQAIAGKKTVQMRYDSASRGRTTRREVDPYRLWFASGGLYLIAYCHLRREPRMFAVERIKSVTATDHPYQMPLHFDLDAFVQDALTVMRGPRIEVVVEFDKATAAWAKDRVWHVSQKLQRRPGGCLRMTLTVADTRELIGWILSFGSGVTVVEPATLRRQVMEEAKKIATSE